MRSGRSIASVVLAALLGTGGCGGDTAPEVDGSVSPSEDLSAPATLTDWRPVVHEMRLFKSPEELEVMRRAGEISALARTRAMQKCRPGLFEYQLEGEILHEFSRHGARFPSYNTIVGGGDQIALVFQIIADKLNYIWFIINN